MTSSQEPYSNDSSSSSELARQKTPTETVHPSRSNVPQTQQMAQFYRQMSEVYSDAMRRVQASEWERLLVSVSPDPTPEFNEFSLAVFCFFQEHPYIPQRAWKMLDAFFGWSFDAFGRLTSIPGAAKMLSRETDSVFTYEYSDTNGSAVSEKYLFYKRSLRDAAIEDRRDDVRRFYELATQICNHDPELYIAAFWYYDRLSHWEQTSVMISYAWEALGAVLQFRPNDFVYEIKKPEYMLKRGFDSETLEAYRVLAKKYPMKLSIVYKRMETLLALHDRAGATAERALLLSSGPRIRKELEKCRLTAPNPLEIDSLIAENEATVAELNAKYPNAPIATNGVRSKPFRIAIIAGAVLLATLFFVFALPALLKNREETMHLTTATGVISPETVPDTVSEAIADFGAGLQTRYPNDVYSHSLNYAESGYLDIKIHSMQEFTMSTQEQILEDISGFVKSRRSTYPDEFTPVYWRVTFAGDDGTQTVYLSDPYRIAEGGSSSEVWTLQDV